MCVSINNSGLHTEISFVFRSQSNRLHAYTIASPCGVPEGDFLRCFIQENIAKTDLCAAYSEKLPSNALLFYFGEEGAG